MSGAAQAQTSDGSVCATSGALAGLSDAAAQNARTVAAVAAARAGQPGALIAVTVGLAESGMRILGNTNDPAAAGMATQGVGADHDSLGIFQQRASWGSVSQRLDPVASTNLFIDRLLALPGWQGEEPWQAAQDVQVSAYDGDPRPANDFSSEYGGNYRAQLTRAERLLSYISHDAAVLDCDGAGGSAVGAAPLGTSGSHGLPTDYTIPPATSSAGRTATQAALAELGKPYVFGAAGPDSFDCSGLTQWAWARAGISLPHYTVDQWQSGTATDADSLAAGDLVLVPGSDGTLANPQHVGMYIGRGLVVEAPQSGDVVKVVTYSSFVSAGLSGLRHIG